MSLYMKKLKFLYDKDRRILKTGEKVKKAVWGETLHEALLKLNYQKNSFVKLSIFWYI